jgi:hypothetical protein
MMAIDERFEYKSCDITAGNGRFIEIITDRETGVSYMSYNGNTGFTVIVDKDGKPYISK